MSQSPVLITKVSGQQVPFDPDKMHQSLLRVGALPDTAARIVREIQTDLAPGTSTRKLYQQAFNALRKSSRPLAAKYKLQRAVMELGPSGYPFEQFVGALLRAQGYTVEVGIQLRGKCVSHEVDVLADLGERRVAIECKFGATSTKRLDVKIALYIRSRVQDLIDAWQAQPGGKDRQYEGWIVTNGDFSNDARDYGTCAGLHLIAWNFPSHGNLKDLIEHSGLYPVTTLITLTKAEKKLLLDQDLVLVRHLREQPQALAALQLSKSRQRKVEEEIDVLT
jgi:hypothetical protein